MAELAGQTFADADLLNLPRGSGERYELIEGELQIMAAAGNRHGQIASTVAGYIFMYLQQNKVGVGVAAETGFYTRGDRRTVRAADYAFIPNERIPVDGLPAGYSQIVPALVVEVVSPFDTAAYIEQKVGEWLDFGVRLVWVLYPDTRHVYIYRQEEASPRVLKAADTIEGGDVLPGFSLTVGKFFEG